MTQYTSQLIDPAPTTYGFPHVGHVFAINDPDEILYEYLDHDASFLRARPVHAPALIQEFPQGQVRALLRAEKLDARLDQNSDARRRTAARNRDIEWGQDLSDSEKEELIFYSRLARRVQQMYENKETRKTDEALARAIPRMAELIYNINGDESCEPVGRNRGVKGRGRKKSHPIVTVQDKRIGARKSKITYDMPSPSTMRKWISTLIEHDWDELSIRDRRKGRCANRPRKLTETLSYSIMGGWVRAYLDRNRPSVSSLYRLMVGSVLVGEVNDLRDAQGKHPLDTAALTTFAQANEQRTVAGLPKLPVPSLSTFERAIRELPSFEVVAARHGTQEARRRHKIAGRREAARQAGERVAIDSWRIQLMVQKLPQQFWAGLPDDLIDTIGALRLNFTVAICEATKVILGARLSTNADGETTLRTLEMVCRDKSRIALDAGCRSAWSQTCTPGCVPTDSGAENIDKHVLSAIRDIGSMSEIGPAKHPDARASIERFFRTIDCQFMQFFQGRTFAGVNDKGDYQPEKLANLLVENLGKNLIRYIVDVYHNSPHGGLGGQTPNDAWVEKSQQYGVVPPPAANVMRAAFGFADSRRIQNTGVRFLGLWYRSEELGKLRSSVGQNDVRIRVDLEDLGTISVRENRKGATWFSVPCDNPMRGVSAAEWIATVESLRCKHAELAKLKEPIVLAALEELRRAGLRSAVDAGIGPSTLSYSQLRAEEAQHFKHFNIVPAANRGTTFKDIASIEAPLGDDPEAITTAGEAEHNHNIVRRRGRLGADFLKGN